MIVPQKIVPPSVANFLSEFQPTGTYLFLMELEYSLAVQKSLRPSFCGGHIGIPLTRLTPCKVFWLKMVRNLFENEEDMLSLPHDLISVKQMKYVMFDLRGVLGFDPIYSGEYRAAPFLMTLIALSFAKKIGMLDEVSSFELVTYDSRQRIDCRREHLAVSWNSDRGKINHRFIPPEYNGKTLLRARFLPVLPV